LFYRHAFIQSILFFAALLAVEITNAQIKLPEIFSDNMILQRDKPVAIWGSGMAAEKVTVKFAGQTKSVTVGVNGRWQVVLSPLKASAVPKDLTVSGTTDIILKNILVGDVWLCSGQSNMEYPLDRKLKKYAAPGKGTDISIDALTEEKPAAIRYLYVEKNLKKLPQLPTKGWTDGNDSIVKTVSAIGYFFAKEIYAATNVPVGIISSSWGGTRIEQWTPDWAYANSPIFKDSATTTNFNIDGMHPGEMYNSLIFPFIPFTMKGVLWYQGESNAIVEDPQTYPAKFELLVNTWRKLFKENKLPFYYVQIAPHLYTSRKDPKKHSPELLPQFWEAQSKSLSLSKVGMVVTTDLVDNLKDIHPSYKWIVAHRLALLALAKEYSKKSIKYSSPVYQSMKKSKGQIELSFTHSKGLKSSDGNALTNFSVAGADGVFVPAEATIRNNKIIITAAAVAKPEHVRFAWQETAQPNLVNEAGLPASPFRTKL